MDFNIGFAMAMQLETRKKGCTLLNYLMNDYYSNSNSQTIELIRLRSNEICNNPDGVSKPQLPWFSQTLFSNRQEYSVEPHGKVISAFSRMDFSIFLDAIAEINNSNKESVHKDRLVSKFTSDPISLIKQNFYEKIKWDISTNMVTVAADTSALDCHKINTALSKLLSIIKDPNNDPADSNYYVIYFLNTKKEMNLQALKLYDEKVLRNFRETYTSYNNRSLIAWVADVKKQII